VSYTADPDPLCYPGTTVLRNLLDIRDAELLEEVELALFLTRAEEPLPPGSFDVEHLLAVHHFLFQDVYPWAGQIRTIRIGKQNNWFCYPEYIASELDRAFAELGNPEALHTMPRRQFSGHVAHFIAELNAVHPFREGNGRTQLTFLVMLAEHAGYGFDTAKLDRDRVLRAMIDSFSGDEARLAALIEDAIA
jgi:cell filamentation protein